MSLKYLVTGASGQLGAQVIDRLLKTEAPETIGALVRRPEAASALEARGVAVRVASYDAAAALRAAFAGVERLLLVSSSEVGQRAPQHRNVIEAAKAAGVDFIAYTSLLRAKESPLGDLPAEHIETEDALAASGLHYAVLRNGWYTENYAMSAAPAIENGAFIGAAGDGRIASAARKDYAEAAAAVLMGDLPASGTIYELAGDTCYTLTEFAAELSRLTGKDIPYVNMTEAKFKETLLGAGLPEALAKLLSESDRGASVGGLDSDDGTLGRLIGRPTTAWQDTLNEALA